MKKRFGSIFSRAAAICLALISAAALFVGVSAHNFRDVYDYDEAIDLLSSIEVIKGYSSTQFAPDDPVTRWQMALLISKLRTGRVATSVWEATGASTAFTDVQASRHYPAAINYAHNNGIIVGRSADVFDPDANISVQDGITMCVRALGYPRNSFDSGYPNSYISKGKELGLFEGLYNLSYTATLSRGQTAQMLYNALFAPTYSGATLADDAFGFVDSNIVLAATENLRFDTNVKYASRGKYVFAEINDYGRLGDSFELDADMFDFDDANKAIGTMYSIKATGDFETILSLELVSTTLSESRTTGLTVSSNSTITLGGNTYTPKSVRSYALETGKAPSTKEIIIYSLNDDLVGKQFSSGNLLTVPKISGTSQGANKYYTMTAYDDNGDGYADRAFLRTYSFGQYKLDNGRLAIADNNSTSAITVTGKTTVKDGDYVIYSYDSQTKTLDIMKILTKIEGTVSAYGSTNSTITVDNVNYYLGWDEVKGAEVATVAKDIKALASVSGRKISGYVDNDNRIIFSCTLQSEEISLEGNYYYNNIGTVTNVNSYMAGDVYATAQPTLQPAVVLDGTKAFLIATYNGQIPSTMNLQQLVGKLVTFTVVGTKAAYVNNSTPTTMQVVDLKDCASKPTLTFTQTDKLYMYFQLKNNVPTLTINNAATGAPLQEIILANNGFVSIYGTNQSGTYNYETISQQWTINDETSTNGFSLTNGYYYSFYIDGISSYYGGVTANAIYIRPFDFANYAATTTAYNSIVYISSQSIQTAWPTYNQTTGAQSVLYQGAFDLATGSPVNVSLSSTKGTITTPGYYKALSGYITDATPITSSIIPSQPNAAIGQSTRQVSLLINPSISGLQSNSGSFGGTGSDYVININGTSYYLSAENIRIYQINTSSYNGYSTSTMQQISKYQSDGVTLNPSYSAMFSLIQGNTSYIKAIYMENIVTYGSYYPTTAALYIII